MLRYEISRRIRSGFKAFNTPKYGLNAKRIKTKRANLFNRNFLPAMLYESEKLETTKKEEQRLVKARRTMEKYKLVISLRERIWSEVFREWSERRDRGIPKAEVPLGRTCHKVPRQQMAEAWGVLHSAEDTVSVFQAPPKVWKFSKIIKSLGFFVSMAHQPLWVIQC